MKRAINIPLILVILLLSIGSIQAAADKTNQPPSKLTVDSARYKITYEKRYVRNPEQKDNITTIRMVLYPGNSSALYVSQDKAVYDSLYNEFCQRDKRDQDPAERQRIRNISRKNKISEIIVQDYPERGKTLVQNYFGGGERRYIDGEANQDWTLHDETMDILGYNCHKATCSYRGRDYEAWYTEDIPISRGPNVFTGLPGLILKLKSLDNEYDFSMIGFEKVVKPFPLQIPNRYIEMLSREDYRFLERYYRENAAAAILNTSGPVKLNLTPEEQKELEKRLNRPLPYNPIEKE